MPPSAAMLHPQGDPPSLVPGPDHVPRVFTRVTSPSVTPGRDCVPRAFTRVVSLCGLAMTARIVERVETGRKKWKAVEKRWKTTNLSGKLVKNRGNMDKKNKSPPLLGEVPPYACQRRGHVALTNRALPYESITTLASSNPSPASSAAVSLPYWRLISR